MSSVRSAGQRGRQFRLGLPALMAVAALALVMAGCAASATGSGPAEGTATATATTGKTTTGGTGPACATTASATAEAWDFGQQMEGRINGGSVTQLSHFQYPLGIPDENAVGNAPQTSFLAWAPDAKHLAVAIMQDVPFSTEYNPYIVDMATHAATRVPLAGAISVPSEAIGRRIFSWADTHTLIVIQSAGGGQGGGAYSYDIASGSLSPLPGIAGAEEGVVRCGTLFYSSYGAFTPVPGAPTTQTPTKAPVLLHRYSLAAHAEAGNPIPLGDASTYPGAEGQIDGLGWDVSRDGAKVAYQQTKVAYGDGNLVTTSTFWAANVDGSGAVRILTQATANSAVFLAISPNGQQVAVTAANPTPNVLSGSMGGGNALSYTPDSDGAPAWLADSSGFDAQLQGGQGVSAGLYRYLLTAPLNGQGRAQATEVQPGGINPAALP